MISLSDINFIKSEIFGLLEFNENIKIIPVENENIFVDVKDGIAKVGASKKAFFAYGLTLVAKSVSQGKDEFHINLISNFDDCGVMLDVSRNAVMRVSAVKEYIRYMASFGLDMLMLYMEDVFEMKEYPYFGYIRGRYTKDELMEIDDYADKMGVELIPCVQTLGHLHQYLKWEEASNIKDTNSILLCGSEKTKIFIDCMLKTLRGMFKSQRIHIGMDEAVGVGLGNYLAENGFRNGFDIINDHLAVVLEICEKYNFKPMMWSDMFFRLNSKTNDYYDENIQIDLAKTGDIPNVNLVYWDYYHTDFEFYDKYMSLHNQMCENTVFAGGIWIWCGLLPNINHTLATMIPGLKACIKNNVKTVFATAWGDDGTDTNHMLSLSGLGVFSQYRYLGNSCTVQDIEEIVAFILNTNFEDFYKMAEFHQNFVVDTKRFDPNFEAKMIFYSDILYNLTGNQKEFPKWREVYKNCNRYFEENNNSRWSDFNQYAAVIFAIMADKCFVLDNLRPSYEANNKEILSEIASEYLPSLIANYNKLYKIHEAQWIKYYKVFGWEELSARYGAVNARLIYAKKVIEAYVNGETSHIEELEFDFIQKTYQCCASYRQAAFSGM